MNPMRIRFIIISLLISYTFLSNAQVQKRANPAKWDLKFSVGLSMGNPTRKDFFNEGLPDWSITDYNNHLPMSFEVTRSLKNKLSTGINISRRGFEGTFFTVSHKFISTAVAPVLQYNIKDLLFIGGGPAIYFVRQRSSYNPEDDLLYKMLKFGFESELSLRIPGKSRLYFQINASYFYAGRNKVFEFMDVQSGINAEPLFYYARNMSLSYSYFGAGIGLRL